MTSHEDSVMTEFHKEKEVMHNTHGLELELLTYKLLAPAVRGQLEPSA